ncbi:MAG: TIGR03435 family protein [Chitinophagaceae bacterium]
MKIILVILFFFHSAIGSSQPILQPGEAFPNYLLRPVVNAPSSEIDVWDIKGKYIILNFWGTWCAPCIPEMDSLGKLQKTFAGRVQIIGISNDDEVKLKNYLKKRPSQVWLASDTTSNLYRQAGFRFVGQSLVLDPNKKIIGVVKSDSINTAWMEKLLAGKTIISNGETDGPTMGETGDPFGIDSTVAESFSFRSFLSGKPSMSMTYLNTALEGRRLTYMNVCLTSLYRDAYGIESRAQLIYEFDENEVCNYDDDNTLVCFDLLVKPSQKDSLLLIMQQKLRTALPFKVRTETRKLSVFVLSLDSSGLKPMVSKKSKSVYSYSGNGFSGSAVPMKTFAGYLANEAGRPVVDETGLVGVFDIETKLTLRSKEEILNSLKPLGLRLEKAERELPVVVISR